MRACAVDNENALDQDLDKPAGGRLCASLWGHLRRARLCENLPAAQPKLRRARLYENLQENAAPQMEHPDLTPALTNRISFLSPSDVAASCLGNCLPASSFRDTQSLTRVSGGNHKLHMPQF